MAIEAKFRITDPGIFWSLQTIDHLAKYSLSKTEIEAIDDAYLDTKKRKLLAAGYCCRRRNQGKGFLITLTKLRLGKGAAQKQQKREVALKKNKIDPADWPKSQARSRVLKVAPNKKLQVIFAFDQTRITRRISYGKQAIALANLDDVSLMINGKEQHFKILKLKITAPSQEKHLNALIEALQAKWPLETEPLSKFERALAMEKSKTK
jgi:inorganic triphosphatase YgiF